MEHLRKGIPLFPVFLWFFFSFPAPARLYPQESILFSYERNFTAASLSAKPGILRDAATDPGAGEFIGSLCETALQFALANQKYFSGDPGMISLVAAAAGGAAAGGNPASVNTLWELFQVYRDPYSRTGILGALAVLGKGDALLIKNLNGFLGEQAGPSQGGSSGDFHVLTACTAALGKLGDSSSYPVLFAALARGYPPAVAREITGALEAIEGDYKDYLAAVIRENPFPEKALAFSIGADNGKITPAGQGELAQAALEAALGVSGGQDAAAADSLRYGAVAALTRLKWSPAAPLAVRNFYRVQVDYPAGSAPRERFLEAIACLGVMGSSEAAQALALQLGYINSQAGETGVYDGDVVLALINALGGLGDKAAFDNLLHVGYLNYPSGIQAAAREALSRLKW